MHPLSGPYLIGMIVLALGGLLKIVRPDDTTNAMRTMGFPSHRLLSRGMGVSEIGLAVGAVALPGPLFPILAGITYLAFAAFVVSALRRGIAIQSCGCFGRVDTPPSLSHVVVNIAAAASSFAFAATSNTSLARQVLTNATEAIPLVSLSAVGVYVVYLALTALPETLSKVHPERAR